AGRLGWKGVGVASRVIVKITGAIGIDDVDRLRADLAKEVELDWREERPPDGEHLGGIGELLLGAVIGGVAGKGTEVAIDVTVERVREVVSRWRDRRLDPPDVEVGTQDVPEEQPGSEIPARVEATGAAG